MILDYIVFGQVRITVFSYIEDILTAFYKEDPKGKGANYMDNDASWNAILHTFGLLNEAVTKFTDDLSTVRDLMVYNPTHIKDVINKQNTIYHNHSVPNQLI